MATNVPPVPGATGAPTPKKTSPIVWILIAIAGLFFLAIVAIAGIGFFAYHKVKQAGFDMALLEKKPELAFVKMAVAANPDAEIISIDEGRGVVSVKDRKTGKVVTLNFEDIRQGRFSLEEGGKKVTLGASSVSLPSWFPAYRGAKLEGFSAQSDADAGGAFGFKTADAPDTVASFYESELKKGGFNVELTRHAAGAMLSAEAGGRKAVINVLGDASAGGSVVNGTFEGK
ncbi:MAG TPA: hypothetical protein VF767_09245 [Bryobacteraceae bacterium]